MAAKFIKKEQLIKSVRKLSFLFDTSRKEYQNEMHPFLTANGSINLTTSLNLEGSIQRQLKLIV